MKKKVFWIIYYAVAVLALVMALIVFRKHITLTLYSLWPVGYIVFLLGSVWYSYSDLRTHMSVFASNSSRKAYSSIPLDRRRYATFENVHPQLHPIGILNSKVYLLFIPIFAFFVFFFSDKCKFHSVWLFIVIMAIITGVGGWYMITNDYDGRRARYQKELKEQQEREESGKWK